MSKFKFKIGDRVHGGHGSNGVIIERDREDPDLPYRVDYDPTGNAFRKYWETEDELTLVETPEADPVEHPAHYQHPSGIEVIDITKHETFVRGNIIKYVLRAPYKGTELQDLKKAKQYLEWEIERLEASGD